MVAKIYTKNNCTFCEQAKLLMNMKGIEYHEVNIDNDPRAKVQLLDECEKINVVPRTAPQIWMDDEYVGGYEQLRAYIDNN